MKKGSFLKVRFMILMVFMSWGSAVSPGFTQISFTDNTIAAGLEKTTQTYGPNWADFDGDGLLDLFVGNHLNEVALYHNNGDGTFSDIAATALTDKSFDFHGGAWGDYDNDGDPDLYVVVGAQKGNGVGLNHLFRNEGNSVFTNVGASSGVEDQLGRGRGVAWADYDNDGDIDLFVANVTNTDAPNVLFKNNGDGTFVNVAALAGVDDIIESTGGVSWADYNQDGDMDLFLTNVTGLSILYQNNGDGTFTNTNLSSGVDFDQGQGMAWGDYDNDGDMDLYVVGGEPGQSDTLVWSAGEITFGTKLGTGDVEDGIDFLVKGQLQFKMLCMDTCTRTNPEKIFIGLSGAHPLDISFSPGADNINPIGQPVYTPGVDLGIFLWKDLGGSSWHIRWSRDLARQHQVSGSILTTGQFIDATPVGFEVPEINLHPNVLYRNNGDGTFTDVTLTTGIAGIADEMHNGRAVFWGDFDNDRDLDLFIVNAGIGATGNEPSTLYENQGNGQFVEVSSSAGVAAIVPGSGNGAATGDYDNDGFLDVFVTNGFGTFPQNQGPYILYKNDGNENHWLKIKLVGTTSNRDGIGAKVTLEAGGVSQFREQNGGTHLYSQNSSLLHFGLESQLIVDRITVVWPSGMSQILESINVDQTLTILEP